MAFKIAELYVEIRANATSLHSSLGTVRKRLIAVNKSMEDIARIAKRAFAISAAAIGGAIYTASKFEKQMKMISTMLDEASMKFLPAYTRAVRNLSIEFGQSTETIAKGLYDILSASVAPEKALNVLRVASLSAVGGFTDIGTAADALTTVLNSYGIAAENAMMVSDKLHALVLKGKVTYEQVAQGIGKVAATASMAGMSLNDLFAGLATTTRAGVHFEQATTAMVGILRGFLKSTDEGKDIFRKLSKEVTGTGYEMNTTTLKALGLTKVMRILSVATQEQISAMFPNIRGLKAIAAIMKDTAGQADSLKIIMDASGRTMTNYNKAAHGMGMKIRQMKQMVTALLVEMGQKLTPVVASLLSIFKDFVKWVDGAWVASILKWTLVVSGLILAMKALLGVMTFVATHPLAATLVALGVLFASVTSKVDNLADKMRKLKEEARDRATQKAEDLLPWGAMSEDDVNKQISEMAAWRGKEFKKAFEEGGIPALRAVIRKRVKELSAISRQETINLEAAMKGRIVNRPDGSSEGPTRAEALGPSRIRAIRDKIKSLVNLDIGAAKGSSRISDLLSGFGEDFTERKIAMEKAAEEAAEFAKKEIIKGNSLGLKLFAELQESKLSLMEETRERNIAILHEQYKAELAMFTGTQYEKLVAENKYLSRVKEEHRKWDEKEAQDKFRRDEKNKQEQIRKLQFSGTDIRKRLGFLTGLRGAIESTFLTNSEQQLREINRNEAERLKEARTDEEKAGIREIANTQRQAVKGGGAGRFEDVGALFKRLQSAAANPTVKMQKMMLKLMETTDTNIERAAKSLESIDKKLNLAARAA